MTSFQTMLAAFALACGLSPCGEVLAQESGPKPLLPGAGQKSPAAPARPEEILSPPKGPEVKARVLEWVAGRGVTDPKVLNEVASLWTNLDPALTSRDLFERTIETFRLVDADTRQFVEACTRQELPLLAPRTNLLDKRAGTFHIDHLRLFYARYLAQRRMYDEALEQLDLIEPRKLVDPATCLFFRAVAEHQLLKRSEALATINKLLKNTQDVPVSYATVAGLMQEELNSLRAKSLDEISRKMSDSERRLDLARPGERVQKIQGEIIADLDEIIKKMEEDEGGGGGGGEGSGEGRSNQSSAPAKDSTVKGTTAPGEVDKKPAKRNSESWGNLPPKERTQVMNIVNRNFPANYRRATEAYTRKISTRIAPTPGK